MNNGMLVSMWGPPGWRYLHSVAHGYPESPADYDSLHENPVGSTESNYKMFFSMVGKTLPCRLCRDSYIQFVSENPVRAGSRQELTRWLWEIHNKVNEKLGRTYEFADFDSTTKYYEGFRAKCTPNSKGCTEALHPIRNRCFIIISYMNNRIPVILLVLSLFAFLLCRKEKNVF